MAVQNKAAIQALITANIKNNTSGSDFITPAELATILINMLDSARTINGNEVIGTGGDIIISGSGGTIDANPTDGSNNAVSSNGVFDALATKQATLVGTVGAGQNLKTVNGNNLLGTGDLVISGGSGVTFGLVNQNAATIEYLVLTGAPVVTFTKSGGVGTVGVTGGTVKYLNVQVDLNTTSDLDGVGNFALTINGLSTSLAIKKPLAMLIDTKAGALPSTTNWVYKNQGSAPVLSISAAFAGGSVTIKSVSDLSAIGDTVCLVVNL